MMWKEATVVSLKMALLFHTLRGETKENYEKLRRFSVHESNRRNPEYKTGVLTTQIAQKYEYLLFFLRMWPHRSLPVLPVRNTGKLSSLPCVTMAWIIWSAFSGATWRDSLNSKVFLLIPLCESSPEADSCSNGQGIPGPLWNPKELKKALS